MSEKEIEALSKEFEEAQETLQTLSNKEIEGKLSERVKQRTDLAMAEIRYKTASKKLSEAINKAVEES